ncbi:hypothetical protein SELMODRAFT_421658 [Selaginella moellendorffii]|uniref:Uncharacterized protein n=1 Tax=Selaginella moellendorffii TaxID=88036 RepID=D8SFY6_SELML|nr:hypothetical protein SELMODRAFT_421658 [Selaginella moellendorffii]
MRSFSLIWQSIPEDVYTLSSLKHLDNASSLRVLIKPTTRYHLTSENFSQRNETVAIENAKSILFMFAVELHLVTKHTYSLPPRFHHKIRSSQPRIKSQKRSSQPSQLCCQPVPGPRLFASLHQRRSFSPTARSSRLQDGRGGFLEFRRLEALHEASRELKRKESSQKIDDEVRDEDVVEVEEGATWSCRALELLIRLAELTYEELNGKSSDSVRIQRARKMARLQRELDKIPEESKPWRKSKSGKMRAGVTSLAEANVEGRDGCGHGFSQHGRRIISKERREYKTGNETGNRSGRCFVTARESLLFAGELPLQSEYASWDVCHCKQHPRPVEQLRVKLKKR